MSVSANHSDDIIKRLMDTDTASMKDSIELRRTGAFQSRTVKVGNQECSLDQLITQLGSKINEAKTGDDAPDLEKLKAMLTAVSDKEKDRRGIRSSLYHLFSSRDRVMDKLQHNVDMKITEHKAYEALQTGHRVDVIEGLDDSDLVSNLTAVYSAATPIDPKNPNSPREARLFIPSESSSETGWSMVRKNADAQEVLIYITKEPIEVGYAYVIALAKNGANQELTAKDLAEILEYHKI